MEGVGWRVGGNRKQDKLFLPLLTLYPLQKKGRKELILAEVLFSFPFFSTRRPLHANAKGVVVVLELRLSGENVGWRNYVGTSSRRGGSAKNYAVN